MTNKTSNALINEEDFIAQIVSAVRSVTGEGSHGLHEPCFRGRELEYLRGCIESTFVSSVGKYVDEFESRLCEYTGSKYVIAISSGTAALELALKIGGVNRDDEVIIPTLTFAGTANAVVHCGAVPHFVDCDAENFGISIDLLRDHLKVQTEILGNICVNKTTNRPIRAIVPVHVFGHPASIEALLKIGHDFKLAIIEDAAESLGSWVGARHTGTFGVAGVLSFNGNKIITTGGGGAILTNDKLFAVKARHLSTTAKVPHKWAYFHDQVGFNFRLPNLNAALGCAQMEQLQSHVKIKREVFKSYKAAFKGHDRVKLVSEPKGCKSNYWLQTIQIDHIDFGFRDRVLEALNDDMLGARPVWSLLHKLPHFLHCPKSNLGVATQLERSLINLPSGPSMSPAQSISKQRR